MQARAHIGWGRRLLPRLALMLLLAALPLAGPSHGSARPYHILDKGLPSASAGPELAPRLIATTRAIPPALRQLAPIELVIPRLGIDAPILALGPTRSGAMQAPVYGGPSDPLYTEVYWWDVGALPGQIGNAVIAGHINRPDGSPGIFGTLNLLDPGDIMDVVMASGNILTFVVTGRATPLAYAYGGNNPTIQRIFGPALVPNLNLITCWGRWDGRQYNRRLVIYTTLVGTSPFPAPSGVLPQV